MCTLVCDRGVEDASAQVSLTQDIWDMCVHVSMTWGGQGTEIKNSGPAPGLWLQGAPLQSTTPFKVGTMKCFKK